MHSSISKIFLGGMYTVGHLKSFHKDSDCHEGQPSCGLMCNVLQPKRAFLNGWVNFISCKTEYYVLVKREGQRIKNIKPINITSPL